MANHLVTTPIKIGRCTRCSAFVFSCHIGGVRTAADPVPLDTDAYRQALITGRRTYRVLEQSGRPWKLETDTASWTSDQPRVAGHTCGASPLDAPPVEELPEAPPVTACDAWKAQGWTPSASCPREGSGGRTELPVSCRTCEPPPFDYRFRCATCGIDINPEGTVPHFAIEHGTEVIWAAHAQCP